MIQRKSCWIVKTARNLPQFLMISADGIQPLNLTVGGPTEAYHLSMAAGLMPLTSLSEAGEPCQSAPVTRGDEDATADGADVAPVSVPKIPEHPLLTLGKALWILGSAQAVVLGAVIGGYFSLKSDISTLSTTLTAKQTEQQKEIDSIKNWLKDPHTFPGSKQIVTPPDAPPVASAVTPTPQIAPSAGEQDGNRAPIRDLPSNIQPTSPPECVSRTIFKRMPCERAVPNTCRGLSAYSPERYREIRMQAGVGEYMLVCNEKPPGEP